MAPARDKLMGPLSHVPWIVLWPLETALLVVWVATVWQQEREGLPGVPWAVVVIILLAILYFAEGLELAFADLRDKDPEQIANPAVRKILKEIGERSDFFFAQRQVFVVAIISFVTLVTAYDWVYIPFFKIKLSGHNIPFWFSFVFTSITVLWFAQVTPKRLAVHNSELFLAHSSFLWPLIKLVAVMDLPAPSHHVVSVIKKYSRYSQPRLLKPSGAAHYNTTTHLYGFAADRSSVGIVIGKGGRAQVTRRYLYLFLHGWRPQMYGYHETDTSFDGDPEIRCLALYKGIVPERFESIEKDLDAIFEGRAPTVGNGFSPDLLAEWPREISIERLKHPGGVGERVRWTITSGRALPEAYWSFSGGGDIESAPFVALLFEVKVKESEGAYSAEGEWLEQISIPCRRLSVSVSCEPSTGAVPCLQGCNATLLDLHTPWPEETDKYSKLAVSSSDNTLTIRHPRQGAFYKLWWKLLPTPSATSPAAS